MPDDSAGVHCLPLAAPLTVADQETQSAKSDHDHRKSPCAKLPHVSLKDERSKQREQAQTPNCEKPREE